MTGIIKTRIDAIKKGELPEGYQKTKAGIMPKDWDGNVRAKQLFKSHTDKKHNGDLEILASTQERGIVPRSQIGIDIQCSDEGVKGYKKVSKGDFVISLRSFQGGIEYSEYDGIVSPAYTILKSMKNISTGFYKNYFKTDSFIDRLNGAVYGIRDGKQIGYEDFGDMYVHCPPLAEQERIAEILMHCDKVIELKQKRIGEEKKKKKSLLRMLTNSLDKESDYQLTNLKELCDFIGDGDWIESKDQSSEGIRLIQTGNIGVNRYLSKDDRARYISEGTFESLNCTEVFNGDLLVSRLPDPIGRVCRVEGISGRAITAVDCTILRFKSEITADWFLQFASSEQYLHKIEVLAGGSTRTRISRKELTRLKFRVPASLQEQQKVVDILSSQDSVIWSLEAELEDWIKKKKALMQLLLTGIVRTTA